MPAKSISKKQIGLIGGALGFVLLVVILGGVDNKNNQTTKQENRQDRR